MAGRPSLYPALILSAALGVVSPALARAQAIGDIRPGFDAGAFPNSPSRAPAASPEDNSPPTRPDEVTGAGTAFAPADQASPIAGADTTGAGGDGVESTAPNYGKARRKKSKLYRPDPKGSPPLPALVPYRGAPGPQRRALNPVPSKDDVDPAQPGPSFAVIQSPQRPRRPLPDPEPFAPIGVRVGELRVLPFVETSSGYETNPNQAGGGSKPSSVLRVSGGLDVNSDFSRSAVTAALRGGYSDFPSNSTANRPDFSGIVDGRIDVTRNDTINVEGRLTIATQTPGSSFLAVPNSAFLTNRPTITSEGASIGGTHVFNRLALTLRGTVDRTQYGDGTQSDGTSVPYSRDDYNDYGIVLRAAYEVSPALGPFAEAAFDQRVHDAVIDISGFARDSVGGAAKVGSTFELTRLLTGTASAGYADRHYADGRLPNLRGPTVDGALVYTATPLTTVTLRAATTLAETTLPGASGAISRNVSLEVAHALFRNFTISGIATYQPNQYQGVSVDETFTQFTLKGAYSFSREVQLIGSASRQKLSSSLPGSSFEDNIFLLGIRLQR